ncbi:MAG: hypothetical protein RRC34_11640 [Lentisphaeria bacterium]|nr:hypothetical protein [Lentisphaeria bacterium]
MLGNNEPIENVDLADVFAMMVREVPWNGLRAYIQSNAQVLKRCTIGGHRLEPKGRKRFEKILQQEAKKDDYQQSVTSGVFAYWYPVHQELHKKLEDYFHSDAYKKYRKKENLDDDAYVLPEARFKEYFDPKDLPKWRILLCFSPLQMTPGQAEKVLKNAGGNEVLIKETITLKEELDHTQSEIERVKNENKELRGRLDKIGAEDQELRNERKQLRKDVESLTLKFETAQAENRKLRDQMSDTEETIESHKAEASKIVEKKSNRFAQENARLKEELETWRKNYEKQRVQARELSDTLAETKRALAEQKKVVTQTSGEIQTVRKFADAILGQIDWVEVGKQLKPTPMIKRKFNSLIKKLNYEEDRSITLGTSLEKFWTALQDEETRLIQAIAQSDVLEVRNGDIEGYWRQLTDVFEDVHISLEARDILLRVLQEIFYQTLDIDDLKKVALPTA